MGCASSTEVDAKLALQAKLFDEKLAHATGAGIAPPAATTTAVAKTLRTQGFDIFVSHAKKLADSEDRAVWVADVAEGYGLRPFFDRSDLLEITEPALKASMLASDVCVTVLDPFTFDSVWVFKENRLAANAGIPIVCIYDADRYRWNGQLDKWLKLYPWVFGRQVVPLTKSQRRTSAEALLGAIAKARRDGRQPPAERIDATMGARVLAKVGVGGSRETETRSAVESAFKGMLSRLDGAQPSLIVCAFTCTHDVDELAARVHELAPTVPVIGCTTCRGVVVSARGVLREGGGALGDARAKSDLPPSRARISSTTRG